MTNKRTTWYQAVCSPERNTCGEQKIEKLKFPIKIILRILLVRTKDGRTRHHMDVRYHMLDMIKRRYCCGPGNMVNEP